MPRKRHPKKNPELTTYELFITEDQRIVLKFGKEIHGLTLTRDEALSMAEDLVNAAFEAFTTMKPIIQIGEMEVTIQADTTRLDEEIKKVKQSHEHPTE